MERHVMAARRRGLSAHEAGAGAQMRIGTETGCAASGAALLPQAVEQRHTWICLSFEGAQESGAGFYARKRRAAAYQDGACSPEAAQVHRAFGQLAFASEPSP